MRPENERALARFHPTCLAWLAEAPLPVRVELAEETPFPLLRIDGVQLASAYDPVAEAELQARLVPRLATAATVYGLAHGALPRTLLAREGLERLRLVVLDPSTARASLAVFDHADWLSDPRVELVRARGLAELEVPFAAAPASLRLAGVEGKRLSDLVVLELATPHSRRHLRAQDAELARRFVENRALLSADGDAAELFGTRPGGTVRVAAAGPTLSDHYPCLRDGSAPLIAVDAALRPLLAAGVTPEIVVSMDAHPLGMRRVFDAPRECLGATTLVYMPSVPGEVLSAWPGARLAAYDGSPRYDALRTELPRTTLFSSGSVVHPAIDLAVRMGARRVELFGCDFATPRERTHVAGCAWEWGDIANWSSTWVLNGHGLRVPSVPNLVGYLRDLERYIACHPLVCFVNAGRDGARIAGTLDQEAARVA